MQMTLASHLQGVVIAKMAIQEQIGQRQKASNPLQEGANQGLDAPQFWRQLDLSFALVLAPFGTSSACPLSTLCTCRLRLLGGSFGFTGCFLSLAAPDLLNGYRKGMSCLHTHQC